MHSNILEADCHTEYTLRKGGNSKMHGDNLKDTSSSNGQSQEKKNGKVRMFTNEGPIYDSTEANQKATEQKDDIREIKRSDQRRRQKFVSENLRERPHLIEKYRGLMSKEK